MVSVPILRGGTTTGVFNVLTAEESAFDPADINYLTSLGSIIQLAFGMGIEEVRAKQNAAKGASGVLTSARSPEVATPFSPTAGVGSSDAADRRETSDE